MLFIFILFSSGFKILSILNSSSSEKLFISIQFFQENSFFTFSNSNSHKILLSIFCCSAKYSASVSVFVQKEFIFSPF